MTEIKKEFSGTGRFLLAGVPEGFDAFVLASALSGRSAPAAHLHIARDATRAAAFSDALAFFAPGTRTVVFPAWDCLPYDRVSPNREVVSQRLDALTQLADGNAGSDAPVVVLTTVNAILQRVPARDVLRGATRRFAAGSRIDLEELGGFFARNGFERVGTVREPGEYAVRGGIVDIYPPGEANPLRLDLFGDEIEAMRAFDPVTQRTTESVEGFSLMPANEVFLDDASISRFRSGYREAFGAVAEDPLYLAVSEGRKQIGMEHWLPLFHNRLETLFDYLPDASVTLDSDADRVSEGRLEMIADYYDARTTYLSVRKPASVDGPPPYRPLPTGALYLDGAEFEKALGGRLVGQFSPFASPDGIASASFDETISFGARRVPDFAAARAQASAASRKEDEIAANVFEAVRTHMNNDAARGRRIVVTAFTQGSRERLGQLLREHGIGPVQPVAAWAEAARSATGNVSLAVLPIEHGFTSDELSLLTEQDILGDRIVRPERKRRRAENFIADVSEIATGDLVVHVDHGIGRYDGLDTLNVAGAPHDCLRLVYSGDDRLYVPVENVEVLSRYGSADMPANLDKLGGAGWQARKARMKERLKDIADQLIRIAAERSLRPGVRIEPPEGPYHEFAARFPYTETEDQAAAIEDTLENLRSGTPMDRLVCGDVGFGKTEVALRAAFASAMSGVQVAVVVPTTLLCRQHFKTFVERFSGVPVRIEQLSRMISGKDADRIREDLANGQVDIVIGTHALLSKSIKFRNLGLLIVDEEQHFGVSHKERLKNLKADVHVLTLTATPIPRTLQMALAGVKEMSLIGTPPVDRLAVRTFVMPYDPVMIREAIMREHFRGGQIFYVCPRIADLDEVAKELRQLVPDIRVAIAHGQMGIRVLEDVMTAFYDGAVDLLLSTQIVESGLDIPTANTLIVHRSDMYGLAQLYQLRGRIGRSKLRAYCYLTLPNDRKLTDTAHKRLEVMQALDTLGAGFTLASHDLDIRGAGNLLGEEQSGHIREVGVELYQHMLEEAVAVARGIEDAEDRDWSPQINIGIPVLIPEPYVSDLGVRLNLYRRIAELDSAADTEAFAAEIIDRFGPLPDEVENLLQIVAIKRFCREAGIGKLDAGPKGVTVAFRNNMFANPGGLVELVTKELGRMKLRPDHTLVCRRDWTKPADRLRGARQLAGKLASIALAA
ncbi:MAG: transcription-repair coupling factor [Rhodospirillaceae bacterium]